MASSGKGANAIHDKLHVNHVIRRARTKQKDSTPPAVRLGAARAILEMGMKLREIVELETRMDELEALVRQQERPGPRGLAG